MNLYVYYLVVTLEIAGCYLPLIKVILVFLSSSRRYKDLKILQLNLLSPVIYAIVMNFNFTFLNLVLIMQYILVYPFYK